MFVCLIDFGPDILVSSKNYYSGGAVDIETKCNSGHCQTFSTSETVGSGKWKVPYINLLIIVYIFLSGLNFEKVKV